MSLKEIPGSDAKLHQVVWTANGQEVNFKSGEVAALLLVRDEVITQLRSGLDEFALALASQINSLHRTGYALDGSTNLNFFDPNTTGAADIALALEVSQDGNKIAASADGSAGNGEIALAIFNLQNELVMERNTSTLNGYYASLAADVGALKQAAENELLGSEVALQQLENWKASAEGVSLDEEMANLISHQHTYTAIAKYLSTIDEMLDTLISIV